ncbi:MAG: hypothetical protein LBB04_02115 [Oscillospiraceae bacterium]|nr:hypothetical protein [Oscillospiraceae bacterium]
MNGYQKGLAKVLAGVFCALCWTPAVAHAEVVTLQPGQLLSDALAKTRAAAGRPVNVEFKLVGDIKETGTVEVKDREKVAVKLEHSTIKIEPNGDNERKGSLFQVQKGGELVISGPGCLDGGSGEKEKLPAHTEEVLVCVCSDGYAELEKVDLANHLNGACMDAVINAGICRFLSCTFRNLTSGHSNARAISNYGLLTIHPTHEVHAGFGSCGTIPAIWSSGIVCVCTGAESQPSIGSSSGRAAAHAGTTAGPPVVSDSSPTLFEQVVRAAATMFDQNRPKIVDVNLDAKTVTMKELGGSTGPGGGVTYSYNNTPVVVEISFEQESALLQLARSGLKEKAEETLLLFSKTNAKKSDGAFAAVRAQVGGGFGFLQPQPREG